MSVLGAFDEAVRQEGEDSAILTVTVSPKEGEPQIAEGEVLDAALEVAKKPMRSERPEAEDAKEGGRIKIIEGVVGPTMGALLVQDHPVLGTAVGAAIMTGGARHLTRFTYSKLREMFRSTIQMRRAERQRGDN